MKIKKLTNGQLKRLTYLKHQTALNPTDEWFRVGQFDLDRPGRRPSDLVKLGLIEEDLEHGYRYRLTQEGKELDTGLVVDTTTGKVIPRGGSQ